jgi:hypothetical protein
MAELPFTTGVFRDYKASVRFHLGKIQTDVYKDSVVQFDGSTLKMDGSTHSIPELRAAIKAGWLTPVGTNVGDYVPPSANVKVRPAMDKDKGKAVSTEVQQDETFVADIKAVTTDGVKIESKKFNATVVRDTEGDGRSVGSATKKASAPTGEGSSDGETVAKLKSASKKSFTVDGSTSMNEDPSVGTDVTGVVEHVKRPTDAGDTLIREGQSSDTGKVLASVKTAAKRKVTLTDANSVDAEISKLDNASRVALAPKGKRDIAALAGDTLEEIVPANEPENRGRMLAEQAKAKRLAALKIKEIEATAPEEGDLPDPADSPIPVAVIDVKPAKVTAKAPKSIEDAVVNGDELELAPGVRWNKKLHWKTRVKQAVQYKDRPEVLDLIRGYEVSTVVKAIDEALAAAK